MYNTIDQSQLRMIEPASEAYSFPLLIKQMLTAAPPHRDQIIVSGDLRMSYASFEDRVARLRSVLKELGVRPGDTVAVMDWDSHRYLECYFAVPMLGAVLLTVNVRLSPDQIAYTLRHARAGLLIHHSDFDALVAQIEPDLSHIRQWLRIADGHQQDTYEALIELAERDIDPPDFDENAIATTFYTTGTTGRPKAVAFSQRQLVLHTLALGTAIANQPTGQGFDRADVYMPLTPMFHVHAWGFPYLATMLGMKQVYPGRYEPGALLELKRREGVTFSHCVPTVLQMLLDQADKQADLAPWTMIIGGSALPPALAEATARLGIDTLAGFGMSETGPVMTIARDPASDRRSLIRAGFPIPLVQMRIERAESEAGAESAGEADVTGELVLRAPWLTQSYPGAPEASQALWAGGWLHTQDVAKIDEDGALVIVDRLKDVIKSGGEWVSAAEIEALMLEHPAIVEAAVIGIRDPLWGERPLAYAVLAQGQTLLVQDLKQHLERQVAAGRISRYAIPDDLVAVAALPKTSVGKLDKKALRARCEEDRRSASSEQTSR